MLNKFQLRYHMPDTTIEKMHVRSKKEKRLRSIPGMVPDLLNRPSGCPFRPRCQFSKEICSKKIPEIKDYGDGHRIRCHIME